MPPNGYVDDDLREDIVTHYRGSIDERFCPENVVPLCNWGCAIWSHVDCGSSSATVLTDDVLHDPDGKMSVAYHLTCSSLSEWLWTWVSGANLLDDMHEVSA